MKILLVHNPVSGNTDKHELLEGFKKEALLYQAELEVYTTSGKNDAEQLEQRLAEQCYDTLVALGGDGTISRIAEHARRHQLPLGVIPGGTSNGLAKDLGIPSNPFEALTLVLEKKYMICLDMILVNEKYHLLHLGDIGANANLLERMENTKKDKLHNAVNFVQEFLEDNNFEYAIKANNREFMGSANMVSFCNARKYGTGVPLTQEGAPHDGLFELVIFNKIDISTLFKSALAAVEETFFNHEDRQIISTKSAVIELTEPQQWQIDGELMPPTRQISLQILPQQFRLICGKDCPYLESTYKSAQ